ncbi:ExbD/TolR family protein [Stigmatella aurantiaca]|uniref:Biopolymer transport protein, ExbD/TolR family n=1 Tax=Stigmatella aurantiaca (strain DW4/3-1) TaxID=378806 RepID=Q094V1_STIAD|nr:biopolymer transporter ExbD [Stigmatella aurantiaca]ADO73221.1 Biopolymer transport protein, ExbD/TolR family [Stigmatella aurantiaca DW4/3-1]EAU67261.1 TonB system transport protein ExbD2 [Stigmatella aurantiaca DW4/3-1]
MAMGKIPGNDDEGSEGVFAEINITPLTDLFLVLLIIFMVTSTVIVQQGPGGGAKAGLKVNLPKGGAADVTARSTDLSVAVLANGQYVLGGNVVTEDELRGAFDKAKADNPDTVVIVQADEGVSHGTVVQVMELAKRAGLGQLAIGVRDGD